MNETRALAVRSLTPEAWKMIDAIAPAMHACHLFGVTSKDGAAAIMIKGWELGMGIGASFEFIQIVQGRPTLSPRGALALVMNSGLLADMKISETETACTIWMKRRGNPELDYQFTWGQADSERAGLVKVGDKGGSAHITYPKLMWKWRAIGFCIDYLFSDVCGGLKRSDEFGADVDTDGNVIVGEWTTVVPSVESTPTPAKPVPTLDELVNTYGPDVVMNAAGGIIPGTDAEVAAVAAKLEGANVSA